MSTQNMSTISVQTREGRLAIPIKKRVELCGLNTFAIHRPVSFDCKGTNSDGWIVSEVQTGLKITNYAADTIKQAIAEAEETLTRSMTQPLLSGS